MNEFEREALLISLERQPTDEGRLQMAKRLISSALSLTSAELGELLALFHFDSSRKEVIELIEKKVEDPENLPLIFDTFRLQYNLDRLNA